MFLKIKNNKNIKYYFFYPLIALIISILLIKLESIVYYKINSLFIVKLYSLKNLNKKEIIDSYLNTIPSKYDSKIKEERKQFEYFFSLKTLSKEKNTPKDIELKNELINQLSEIYHKDFNIIKSIFLFHPGYFGNRMIMLNNIIYYFEILNIKNIYLDSSYNWFIQKNITTDKINIMLISSSKINCQSKEVICRSLIFGILFKPIIIMPEIRLNLIRDEIIRNLIHLDINPNDLYIHFRTGDIFEKKDFASDYSQPPLCFYRTILKNFKFNNIYFISSKHRNNPVINKLIKEFPNIIHTEQSVDKDISCLCQAYNLVGSLSSFLRISLIFNNNLKNYWEYDIYKPSTKIKQFHYDFYNIPIKYTIYKMKPSENYKNEMFNWRNIPEQINLMVEEKCINNFQIIKPNKYE